MAARAQRQLLPHTLQTRRFTFQARGLVPEPEAQRGAGRAAMGVHVQVVNRSNALLRQRLPAPAADDGGGEGAGAGAKGLGRSTRPQAGQPARGHAPAEQACARRVVM